MNKKENIPMVNTDSNQCEPSPHSHRCITYQPGFNNLHKLIHDLPPELVCNIVGHAVIERPCLKEVYNRCFDPWTCREGTYPDPGFNYLVIPSPCVTSCCRTIYDEAYDSFYRHSLLIFSDSQEPYNPAASQASPQATRLLDLITQPSWKNIGSPNFVSNLTYTNIDDHRHKMRHLAFCIHTGKPFFWSNKWRWQFDIDWETLPKLETLCLDLRAYGNLRESTIPQGMKTDLLSKFDKIILAGAERMACLKLKTLIIVGLYSGVPAQSILNHKRRMQDLFKEGLAEGGTLEFWDEEHIW